MRQAKRTAKKLETLIDKFYTLEEQLEDFASDDDDTQEVLDYIQTAREALESAKDICEAAS